MVVLVMGRHTGTNSQQQKKNEYFSLGVQLNIFYLTSTDSLFSTRF